MDLETTDFGKGERRLGGRGERKLKKERKGASRIDRVVLPPSVPKRNEKERKREREREREREGKKVDTIIYTLDRIFMTFYNSEFLLLLLLSLVVVTSDYPSLCSRIFFLRAALSIFFYLLLLVERRKYIYARTRICTHTHVYAHTYTVFFTSDDSFSIRLLRGRIL